MNTLMDLCFLCTKGYNCVPVDDKIVSQVEYLLPEITIIKLGIPLRICSVCDGALYAFNKFKQFYVESSRRLEASIKGAQGPPIHTDSPGPSQLQKIVEIDTKKSNKKNKLKREPEFCEVEKNIEEHSPEKIEEVFIKQEQIDETIDTNLFQCTLEEEKQIEKVKNDETKICENSSSDSDLNNFECPACNQTFDAKTKLTQHIKDSHPQIKKFQCTMCDKSFTRKHIFTNHMKLHTGKKDFLCSICNKAFACRSRLDIHKKIHSTVREFQCEICKKSYSQKYNLDYHMKTHYGIRDFPCTQCDKAFACQSTLKHHLKVHSGVKEFSCYVCGRSFMQKHHYKFHMKKHSDK